MDKSSFHELMLSINDELNIPGRNNKIKTNKLSNSLPLFNSIRPSYILNSLLNEESEEYKNDSFFKEYNKNFDNYSNKTNNYDKIKEKNEKFEKLKNKILENKYRTISYFDLTEDSRLILLRPILKYTLYKNHEKD